MKKYIFVLVALLALASGCVAAADAPQQGQVLSTPTRVAVVPTPTVIAAPPTQTLVAPDPTKEPTKEPTAQPTAAPQTAVPTATLQPVPTGTPTPTRAPTQRVQPTPAQPADTTKFGTGTCTVKGTTYQLSSDSSAVWMEKDLVKAITQYGGSCKVTTLKKGWYWSVAFGTITRNNVSMQRGMALKAEPGEWFFTYDAPESSTTNPSIGLTFRDNMPNAPVEGEIQFGKGSCVVDGKTYDLSANAKSVWQDNVLLQELWRKGGTCTVTTVKKGWYWSVQGIIKRDGVLMANGSAFVAEPGTWTFTYPSAPDENYGFVFHDHVPTD